jgi:hypothetical protein
MAPDVLFQALIVANVYTVVVSFSSASL